MKRFFKILKIAALAFFILIVTLIVVAWAMEDRITKLAVAQISEAIQAPLGMDGVTFSLIHDFPLATIQFKGLWLGAAPLEGAPADAPIDTLARFEKFYVAVESKPLLDNIFNIREIEIKGAYGKYHVDSTGVTCYDFLMAGDSLEVEEPEADTTASAPLLLRLDKLTLTDIRAEYQDEQLKAAGTLYLPEIKISGVLDSLTTRVAIEGSAQLSKCRVPQANLDKMDLADLQFKLNYNTDTVTIHKLTMAIPGAALDAAGTVILGDKMDTDLSVAASNLDLAVLTQYAPQAYLTDYQVSQVAGMLNLKAKVKGVVSDTDLPYYEATFDLTDAQAKYQQYPAVKQVNIKGSVTNGAERNNATTALKLDKLRLMVAGNVLNLKGSVSNLDKIRYNVGAGLTLNLASVKPYLPAGTLKDMSGSINMSFQTTGVVPNEFDVRFIDYALKYTRTSLELNDINVVKDEKIAIEHLQGALAYHDHEISLSGFGVKVPAFNLAIENNGYTVRWEGALAKPESLKVALDVTRLGIDGLILQGAATLEDVTHPTFALKTSLDIDLDKLKPLIPAMLVKEAKGKIALNLDTKGSIHPDSIATQLPPILYNQSSIDLKVADFALSMPDTIMNVEHFSGEVNINSERVALKDMKVSYMGIDFETDTTVIKNLFSTVIEDKPGKLEVFGIWKLGALNYEDLMAMIPGDTETAATEPAWHSSVLALAKDGKAPNFLASADQKSAMYYLPMEDTVAQAGWDMNFDIKGKVYVKSILYEDALLEDISCLVRAQKDKYIVDKLKTKGFDGDIQSAIRVEMKEGDKMQIDIKSKVDKVNIRKMMQQMPGTMAMDSLSYENLSGIVSSDEFFIRLVMKGGELSLPDMRAKGDFTLEKGGIYNYSVVKEMEEVIPRKPNMDTVELKTVTSHVFILDNDIYVPKTYVVSNKFDVSLMGMQSLNEYMDYDYHAEVFLRQILLGKSEKKKKKQEKLGDEAVTEFTGKPTAVTAKSKKGKSSAGLDNNDDKKKMANKVKSQEALLNIAFNPRLVSFETGIKD